MNIRLTGNKHKCDIHIVVLCLSTVLSNADVLDVKRNGMWQIFAWNFAKVWSAAWLISRKGFKAGGMTLNKDRQSNSPTVEQCEFLAHSLLWYNTACSYKTVGKQDHLLISGCGVPAHKCQPPLPSARQHPSYGDCLEVKREYYRNCFVLGCVTQCSQSAAHSYEQFLQVQQIGFVTLGHLRHA